MDDLDCKWLLHPILEHSLNYWLVGGASYIKKDALVLAPPVPERHGVIINLQVASFL